MTTRIERRSNLLLIRPLAPRLETGIDTTSFASFFRSWRRSRLVSPAGQRFASANLRIQSFLWVLYPAGRFREFQSCHSMAMSEMKFNFENWLLFAGRVSIRAQRGCGA